MTFVVSEDERASGSLGAAKLDQILEAIGETGFAVVAGLVSRETCERLMDAALEDVAKVRSAQTKTRHEKVTGAGHLQLGLRRHAPFVRADLLANPLIEHVVAGVLGADAWLGFYNGNVNLPGSVYQPLHFDRPFSWRTEAAAREDGQPWPPPATTLSCSVALSEIREDNGATEIYPGTHRETAVTQWSPEERLSQHPDLVARWGPPARMPIPAGGVCFRDPRMWHRGVPNTGDTPRPMIALTYHARRCQSWRGRLIRRLDEGVTQTLKADKTLKLLDDGTIGDGRLVFDESARGVIEGAANPHRVDRNIRYVRSPHRVNHFVDAHLLGGARVVESGEIGPD